MILINCISCQNRDFSKRKEFASFWEEILSFKSSPYGKEKNANFTFGDSIECVQFLFPHMPNCEMRATPFVVKWLIFHN